MDVEAPRGLLRFFDELEDPRVERNKLHCLADILAIALLAVICGAVFMSRGGRKWSWPCGDAAHLDHNMD